MKTCRQEIWFETKSKREFINITSQVDSILEKSGIREGLCLVNAMHITASVFINDDESGLLKDFETFLERLAPYDKSLERNTTWLRRERFWHEPRNEERCASKKDA